jgi:hypothetical protein
MKVELHIEELVLHGFARAQREPIAAALRQELERLLIERGQSMDIPVTRENGRIDAGQIHASAGAGPRVVGTAIAGAVHGSLPW